MDDDRIDFSPLDPKRNPVRFERMVQAVVAAAREQRQPPLLRELVYWGRTAIAVGAIIALASWLPSLVDGGSTGGTTAAVSGNDPVELVTSWAQSGNVPSDVDLIQTLRRIDEH